LGDLVQELQEWPEVWALRLGGSVARGQADEFSDVEFYAACTSIPPLDRRRTFILRRKDRGTAFFVDEPALGGVLDTFQEAGCPVTLVFQEIGTIEQGIAELLAGSDLGREKEMVFGQEIRTGQILYDAHGLAATWQAQIQRYPARRQAAVRSGLERWQRHIALEWAATSDDPLWAAYRLQDTWEWLVHGLCARHGHYYIGPKRALSYLAAFVERPALARLSESWSNPLSPRSLLALWQQMSAEILAQGQEESQLQAGTLEPVREVDRLSRPRTSQAPLEKGQRQRRWGPPTDLRSQDPQRETLLAAFRRGCDYLIEPLYIAARRGDATGFLYCQKKVLEALIQVLWPLQGWHWAGPLTWMPGMRQLRSLRWAPPALYDRLCPLWAGRFHQESLMERQRQWLELWSELVPRIYQRFPEVDLKSEERTLFQAWSKD
jgi:hypothetical protein